jgi:hypothetical protein
MQKVRQLGLSDVREQFFDLPPQWMPRSWSVTLSPSGKKTGTVWATLPGRTHHAVNVRV